MLIQKVTALAFGPLAEETLELADGLTVVYGANESAKSSWHAAIYAALCGRKRGRGRPNEDEQRFIDLHKPWDRSDWVVSAQVLLDDGRRVELRQDLDGRVDCDAVDLDLGRDCSAEIMTDGTPDAARWLGLDRYSFLATACVAQAQVLDVLRRADGLQGHLQRAASSAGAADQTAASAIDRIDKFRVERVGGERAPTKPLVKAVDAARRSREALERARADHAEYERRLVEVDGLRARADRADGEVRRYEAAGAAGTAQTLRTRADEAVALTERVSRVEVPAPAGDDAVAAEVAAALATWRIRPLSPVSDGRPVDVADLTDEQLRDLARDLEAAEPSKDPAVGARLVDARTRLTAVGRTRARGRWLAVVGLVPVLAAVALLVLGVPLPEGVRLPGGALLTGGVLLAAGALLMVAGLWTVRRAGGLAAVRARVVSAEVDEAAYERSVDATRARRQAAMARCELAGLIADPGALRELAHRRSESEAFARRDEHWRLETLRAAADQVLGCARAVGLIARTADEAVDGLVAWQRERAAVATRIEQARDESARLKALLADLTVADLVEQAAAADQRAHRLLADVGNAGVDSALVLDDDELNALRDKARAAAEAARVAEVSLVEFAARAIPVGEAEEDLARADADLAWLRELDSTLDLTRRFLSIAKERAHRTIAPVLAGTVRRMLPEATGGRYTEVTVDSERLQVKVRGPAGRWRDAGLLSYGTGEQVYLMLRIALAQHLVRAGTVCPLLLDDVTVHADSDRTTRILELLLRASADRQIILFTQQEQTRDWARTRLDGSRHALRELAPVAMV